MVAECACQEEARSASALCFPSRMFFLRCSLVRNELFSFTDQRLAVLSGSLAPHSKL